VVQILFGQLQRASELGQIFLGQELQMPGHQRERLLFPRSVIGQLIQLDRQAIREVRRGHSGRIEILNPMQNGRHFLDLQAVDLIDEALMDVFHADRQIAVVIDSVDNRRGDGVVLFAERRQLHLPVQVILQGLGRRPLKNEIVAVRI
jgi:hypothetical protein